MSEWMTIRVVLLGRRGDARLPAPPGRVLLAHADHSFADLSEALDLSFGRWDLSPLHEVAVEGRRLSAAPQDRPDADDELEDSDDVTLGEAGLRTGSRFNYLFDLTEAWEHDCRVEAEGVDPLQEYGEEPETPVPLYGWGTIPDQYGRAHEDDAGSGTAQPGWDERAAGADWTEADWPEPDPTSWAVVAGAIADLDRPRDDTGLAASARDLRAHEDNDDWPYDVLWAAAGLDDGDLPDDDETLWLSLAAGVVRPRSAVPLGLEAQTGWAALEPADWAGVVIELVRAGTGQEAHPEALLELIARCPEVEQSPLEDTEAGLLLAGLGTVTELWRTLGALDTYDTLTELGRWGLPESLRLAWTR